MMNSYFWGFLSTSDADKTLDRKAGTYLVRFSNSERGVYTLSVITKDLKIANLRILFNVANGKFVLGPKEYETLGHIIGGKQIKTYNVSLKKPCQVSSFVVDSQKVVADDAVVDGD